MTKPFNDWFPTSRYGDDALNVKSFGAIADGLYHPLSALTAGQAPNAPYLGDLELAQVDYPSATALSDTADWCAITECLKHAYKHETSPGSGEWVSNGTEGYRNKPVCFPMGRYLVTKPVLFRDVTHSIIYGTGYVQIYNQTSTPPDNIGVIMDGMQSCRIDNIDMQSAGGTNSRGLLIDAFDASYVNTTGNIFYNCNFISPGGIGCHIGPTQMSSEQTFIKCNASYSSCGFVVDNWNALNYQFLACGGITNTLQWLRVNTGGMIVVQNASLADNGSNDNVNGFDIWNGADRMVILGTRTESKRFVAGLNVTLIGCNQAQQGAEIVFCNAAPAIIMNCSSTMGRVCGPGPVSIDQTSVFSLSRFYVTNAVSVTGEPGGRVKITHSGVPDGRAVFYDGDEVEITGVASTDTTPAGGAAHINGVWTIAKINNAQAELIGSTFVADTYDYTNARIGLGPRGHLREVIYPTPGTGQASTLTATPSTSRFAHATRTVDCGLFLSDSGTTFDNFRATGPVTFTLPYTQNPVWWDLRGHRFCFTVIEAQTLTVQVHTAVITSPSTRIFRAGAYGSAGLMISSNVVGSTVELVLADSNSNVEHDPAKLAYRWLVRSETGTWTIAGTPT